MCNLMVADNVITPIHNPFPQLSKHQWLSQPLWLLVAARQSIDLTVSVECSLARMLCVRAAHAWLFSYSHYFVDLNP